MSQRGPRWKRQGAGIVGFVSLLVGVPVDHASAQAPPDVGNALMNLFKGEATQGAGPQPSSVPLSRPGSPARESSARGPEFLLLGVIIAENTRMALLQDTTANPGGAQLLQIGGSLGGHRLTDVQPDRVTLEGKGGQQLIVRLGTGMGSPVQGAQGAVLTAPSVTQPASSSAVEDGAPAPSSSLGLGRAEPPPPAGDVGEGAQGGVGQARDAQQRDAQQVKKAEKQAERRAVQQARDQAKKNAPEARKKARNGLQGMSPN
jgi:hypothetical protein